MNKQEWQQAYDEAGTARELGRRLGMTHTGVTNNLRKHGIEIRIKRGRTVPVAPVIEGGKEVWQRLYDEAGSVRELARRIGKTHGTVRYHLLKYGIEIHQTGFASPKTVVHYGPDNANWKGGTYYHSDGYIYEYAPDHPAAASAKGYVLQHRLVMERTLGRLLEPEELVHHENEIKDDNRPENLELESRSSHMKGHKEGVVRDDLGRFLS